MRASSESAARWFRGVDMLRIGVTGPDGFLAWHLRCAIKAQLGVDIVPIGRAAFADSRLMDGALSNVDVIFHLAGVNRASSDAEVTDGNVALAATLAQGIQRSGRMINVVYSNSIQSLKGTVFGDSKLLASEILTRATNETGGHIHDVLLPNIFGEHGRPKYNSFIATFCDQLVKGEKTTILEDKEVPLLHAQKAVSHLISLVNSTTNKIDVPAVQTLLVSDVAKRLSDMAEKYKTGQFPNLDDDFTQDLFNTYRSYTFPQCFPIFPDAMTDQRGRLVEAVRADGGETQVFFSTTKPNMTRGEHFHLRKVERFIVLQGTAEIRLRRMYDSKVVTFEVNGSKSAIVDMPTMWAHSITNVGSTDLITLFYADQCFNPNSPDTFAEKVC